MSAYTSWVALLDPAVEWLDRAALGVDWDDYRAARTNLTQSVVFMLVGAEGGASDEQLALATRALVRTAEAALIAAHERWAESHPSQATVNGDAS